MNAHVSKFLIALCWALEHYDKAVALSSKKIIRRSWRFLGMLQFQQNIKS